VVAIVSILLMISAKEETAATEDQIYTPGDLTCMDSVMVSHLKNQP